MPTHPLAIVVTVARVTGVLSLFAASAGLAQETEGGTPPRERVRLTYEAPSGCPDQDAFLADVRSRIQDGWEARPGELARRIDVRVTRAVDGYLATIELLTIDGERVARAVGGSRCDEVVHGIALVTALAIESRVDEVLDSSESVAAPAPKPSTPVPAVVAPETARVPPPRAAVQARVKVRLGARGDVVTGVGPSTALGGGLFGGLEWKALRVGTALSWVESGRVDASGARAAFRLVTFRAEGGPALRLTDFSALELAALFEFGALRVETFRSPPSVTEPGRGQSPWMAPGAVLRMVVMFDPLLLELEAMGRLSLRRERFYVRQPDGRRGVIHQAGGLSGGLSLGAGFRF